MKPIIIFVVPAQYDEYWTSHMLAVQASGGLITTLQ